MGSRIYRVGWIGKPKFFYYIIYYSINRFFALDFYCWKKEEEGIPSVMTFGLHINLIKYFFVKYIIIVIADNIMNNTIITITDIPNNKV